MSIASILAVIDGAAGSAATLTAALRLGSDFKAQVQLLHVEVDAQRSLPVIGEGMTGLAVEQMMQSIEAGAKSRLEEAQRLCERHCLDTGIALSDPDAQPAAGEFAVKFLHIVGQEPDEVVSRARLADLIVMARPSDESRGLYSATVDAALFDSGRPVLFVPADYSGAFGTTVMLAWDGSRESAQAVTAGLPFLRKAGKVLVASGRENQDVSPPSRLSGYLAAHAVQAKSWAFSLSGEGIGSDLLAQAKKAEADLLIMGAYGHSRFRELILGGATRGALDKAEIPVLMSH